MYRYPDALDTDNIVQHCRYSRLVSCWSCDVSCHVTNVTFVVMQTIDCTARLNHQPPLVTLLAVAWLENDAGHANQPVRVGLGLG
jgi:hypothetical protein